MIYCPKCGMKNTDINLYCENCGKELTDQTTISRFSPDEVIAGHLVNYINKNKKISYDQTNNFLKSNERTDRIFAQLERTGNFQIRKRKKKYYLIAKHSLNEYDLSQIDDAKTKDSSILIIEEGKIAQLKALLEFGPILINHLPELMSISPKHASKAVEILLSNNNYQIESDSKGKVISKK